MSDSSAYADEGIAVIGLACRFPEAPNTRAFWANLCAGAEAIRRFTDEELLAAGLSPELIATPGYVKARGFLQDTALFDAGFFDITPREAALMDPQHRFFLECAWEALEDAACDPARYPGPIGVFGGASISTYLLGQHVDMDDSGALLQLAIGNFSDYMATRVAYKLDLRGPAVGIQTACSTSLVAVHLAALNLLAGQCDVALAGGVSIRAREVAGYRYREGGIFSPDGHCRAFDARGGGTVEGSGVGIVVLKRLEDAVADGDSIRAVIRGTAINNDGSMKIGFTAPSVQGQAAAIEMAQAAADLEPEDITYIEAHGTATPLGDPIEIAALRRACERDGTAPPPCAIGAVKSNIGHLDTAAGVAGLIKTVLALEAGQLPPSLHFETPNRETQLADSRFFVNTALRPWDGHGKPRRAGVSSFGIGGTNAHVVVEEAAPTAPATAVEERRILPLSAKTATALKPMAANLHQHLVQHPELDIADVAHTLQVGRGNFPYRMAVLGTSRAEVLTALEKAGPPARTTAVLTGPQAVTGSGVLMMFTGQGAQYADMARGLYQRVGCFRDHLDHCCDILRPQLDVDLRTVLFPPAGQSEASAQALAQTRITQPALFAIEYALARMWMSWGVIPRAMIGHSVGEYVAACLAEVLTPEDALAAIAMRGALMQRQPPGAMLSVPLSAAEVEPLLGPELALAAINGPALTVVSGTIPAIDALADQLTADKVQVARLHTSHGFHSAMMEPAAHAFEEALGGFTLGPPQRRFVSNVTGDWITDAQATDPAYWAQQLRQPVLFEPGLRTLLGEDGVLLEVGPGTTLTSLAKRHPAARGRVTAASLRHVRNAEADWDVLLNTVARLWVAGVAVDWRGLYDNQPLRRVPLPTYPFERQHHWLTPAAQPTAPVLSAAPLAPAAPSSPGDALEAPPLAARPTLTTDHIAPRTATESRVGEIWSSFLGFRDIGIDDGFFELGGDSLLATQVISRLRDEFQVSLALKELFEEPTIAAVAARLDAARSTAPGAADTAASGAAAAPETAAAAAPTPASHLAPALVPITSQGEMPLSFAQERMWVLEQMGPPSTAYHLAQGIRLHGPVDADALEQAFAAVIQRHETLRTSFVDQDGQPFQVVHATVPFVLRREDVRPVAGAERAQTVRNLIASAVEAGFALHRAPLLRALLVREGEYAYTLVITMHHIVTDGWSLLILVRELAGFYAAITADRRPDLTPLPIQYPAFAQWQRQVAQGRDYAQSLRYWQNALAGVPPLTLPLDRVRPPVPSQAGATCPVSLPEDLSRDLEQLCRQQQLTPFMALLAAFGILLHRYSGQRDFAIGVPIAGRTRSEVEPLIGLFVNTLALRFTVPEPATLQDVMGQVRDTALSGFAHQQVPFEQVVDAVQPARDLGRTPLFQVMFSLQDQPVEELSTGPVQGRFFAIATGAAQFELTLWMHRTPRGFAGGLEYNTELFERDTITQMAQHFERVVTALVAQPAQRTSTLPLLSPEQRARILAWGQGPKIAAAPDALVQQQFAARSEQMPDAPAIQRGDVQLTYGALEARANRLAHYLASRDIGPGSRVTVEMELSIDAVVAILAVLKSGAAYVPVALATPRQRVTLIRRQTGATLALTAAATDTREDDVEVVSLPGLEDRLRELPAHCPQPRCHAGSAAYVVHTSGTTGTPKGVVVPHSALATHCESIVQAYELTAGERILGRSSLSFDVAAEEIFPTLAAGGTLVLQPAEAMDSMRGFVEFLAREALTVVNLPSSLWHEWVEELPALRHLSSLPRLRLLVIGNQEPSLSHLRRWQAEAPYRCRLLNAYGTSETTITSLVHEISPVEDASASARVPIGRPIANARAYVVDTHLEPVPVGVEGELCIGGTVLALGYLGQPRETTEAFVPDPFARRPGARLYRTGDRARYRRDGTIEFLGRRDDQIKIRGYRIEVGEIESALHDLAEVRDAAVVHVERNGAEAWLGACVALQSATSTGAGDVQARLGERLPSYMVPTRWLVLDSLPRDPSGKINRQLLADMLTAQGSDSRPRRAPVSTMEKRLATIWQQVLSCSEVGIDDSFFALGGDSLLALRVVARAQAQGIALTARTLFEHQTIASLAAVAASHAGAGSDPADPSAAADTAGTADAAASGPIALGPMPARYFARRPHNPHHDSRSLLLEVPDRLDPDLLEKALAALWHRHDGLRLRFAQAGDGTWQAALAPPAELPPAAVAAINLAHVDAAEQPDAVAAHIARLHRDLDLARAPALRLAWFDLGAAVPGRLLIIAHVLIADAVAWAVLLDDLQTCYDRLARGQPPGLPGPDTSYRRWLAALAQQASSPAMRARVADQVAALRQPCCDLPVDHYKGPNREASRQVVHSRLDPATSRALLTAVADDTAAGKNALLLAVLAPTLCTWSGGPVLVDVGHHGRDPVTTEAGTVAVESTVGSFASDLPIRLAASGTDSGDGACGAGAGTLRSLLAQVRNALDRARGHHVLRFLGAPEDRAQLHSMPRPQVSFDYMSQRMLRRTKRFALAPEHSGAYRDPEAHRTHVVQIVGALVDDALQLEWRYSEALHRRETIAALARDYEQRLRALAAEASTGPQPMHPAQEDCR